MKKGKGIFYSNSGESKGDRYEGDWKNDKREGKGIHYWNNRGDRYEGDWKNDAKEGKGAYYWNNGDCEKGNYKDDKAIGVFARLCRNGEVKTIKY